MVSWAEASGLLEGVREAEEAEEGVVPGRASGSSEPGAEDSGVNPSGVSVL